MKHPGDETLNDYVDGRLDRRSPEEVEAHLQDCDRCRARVAAIRELNDRLARLPREIAPRRDLRPEVLRRVAGGASAAPARTDSAPHGRSRPGLRAAIVALLLAGAGTALWLGLDRGAPSRDSPLIGSYLTAAAELAPTVEDRKAALGPEGARALTESLAAVDAAIRELERARRRGGEDPELLRELEARHRMRLELLRGAVTLLEEA